MFAIKLFLFDINDDNLGQGQSQNKQDYGSRKSRHNNLVKISNLELKPSLFIEAGIKLSSTK